MSSQNWNKKYKKITFFLWGEFIDWISVVCEKELRTCAQTLCGTFILLAALLFMFTFSQLFTFSHFQYFLLFLLFTYEMLKCIFGSVNSLCELCEMKKSLWKNICEKGVEMIPTDEVIKMSFRFRFHGHRLHEQFFTLRFNLKQIFSLTLKNWF